MMKRLRILLADDNEAMLEEVRALLEPEFEIVGVARDGQALLEAHERLQPDILVVDISMPVRPPCGLSGSGKMQPTAPKSFS